MRVGQPRRMLSAMAKVKTRFLCKECGAVHPKWMGKCPDCGAWDALEEFRDAGAAAVADPFTTAVDSGSTKNLAEPIASVSQADTAPQRIATGIAELDRVLGGSNEGESQSQRGLVAGSAVLIGGDPGIGKSTLMLQAAAGLARQGTRVLYVTSEESAHQLKMRADRLCGDEPLPDNLFVLADTNLARIVEQSRQVAPQVLVIDSVQMIYKGDLPAAPGSVTQLRACCMELVHHAKLTGSALLMVGHVTKKGALAGPRLLEHMVDAVLYFEGDRYHSHRIIRGIKNRFGTTLEVGLFEMTGKGLIEITDGRGLLAKEYTARAGSVVCPVLQGSRCLLVEVQALTASGFLGSTKRKVSGLDGSRLAMLIAVLEKRGGLRLADQDIFASSVGGMKISEPAADLALSLAIAGAFLDRSLPEGTCAVGEIGLGGEVRLCQQMQQRVIEASRLGFKRVLAPPGSGQASGQVELIEIGSLGQALEQLN